MIRGAACVSMVFVLVYPVGNAQSAEPLQADRLPDGAVMRLGQSRLALAGEAYSAAFSPDGAMVAVAANQGFDPDNNVHLFDIRSGLELIQLSTANRGIPRGIVLSFSNDGARLLSGDTVWDTASWIRRRPQLKHSVLAVAPNEKLVAVHGEHPNELVIWDVPKSIVAATIATSNDARYITKALFSPDGKTLAVSDDTGHLKLREIPSGKLIHELPSPQSAAPNFVFSPDGHSLAAVESASVLLFDVASGQLLRTCRSEGGRNATDFIHAVQFSPDGKRLLGAPQNRGLIQIWNPVTGDLTETLNIDRSGRINDLAFSANGRYLAVAGSNNGSAIRIFDWKAKQPLFPSDYPSGPIAHLAYSPDGRQIAIATARRDGEISLWDATTGKQSLTLHGNGDAALAYSPDGWELGGVSAVGNYHLWTAEKGDSLIERGLRDNDHVRERPRCAALSPLFDELASGADDGQIHIRAITTGIERRVFRAYSDGAVGAVAWSPDGKLLATARIGSRSMPSPPDAQAPSREAIQLWDTETGQLQKQLFSTIIADAEHYRRNNGFLQLAFSPDGELAAGAFSSGPIVVWNVAGGRQICELACKTISPFCFSADGQMLIYADGYTIQVAELATGQVCLPRQLPAPVGASSLSTQPRMSFRGGAISTIAVAPDGERFATALNRDHTVLIWTLVPDVDRSSKSDAPVTDAELQRLWSRLAAIDAKGAYLAMFQLAAAGDTAVRFIHDHFPPVQADPQQTQRISQLIADLDNDVPAVREKATDDLTTLGVAAGPLLRQALTRNPTLERRTRIEGLLVPLDDPIQHHGGKLLQRIRAVRVLERIATPEAIKLLEELGTGLPAARETHEAERAFEHCKTLANER